MTRWMRQIRSLQMDPTTIEKARELGFVCISCDRPTLDGYILRDGSLICIDCVNRWEPRAVKQN